MYKHSGLIVIAALVISAMGVMASATTPIVTATGTPTVTLTQTKVRDNGYVLLTITVTNPSDGENIENVNIKDVTSGVSAYFTDGVFINENNYENIYENIVENLNQTGSELARVADNLANAKTCFSSAGDALVRAAEYIENAGADLVSSLRENAVAAGSALRDADDDLRKAGNALKEEQLDAGFADNLMNAARDLSYAGCLLIRDDNQTGNDKPLRHAGENLDNAGFKLENHISENVRKWVNLWVAATGYDNGLDNIATRIDNAGLALQRYTGTGQTLILSAATDLDNAASELVQAAENLRMAAENLILAMKAMWKIDNFYLENCDNIPVRTRVCGQVDTETLLNALFRRNLRDASKPGENGPWDNKSLVTRKENVYFDNIRMFAEGLDNAADNQNVWLGVLLASNIIGYENEKTTTSVRYWIKRAAEALLDNDNIRLGDAASAIDNAGIRFTEAGSQIENTMRDNLAKVVGWGAAYDTTDRTLELGALNNDNHIVKGTNKTFKFLWKAPDIGTQEVHTIRVWTIRWDGTTATQNDFTVTVDGEKPSLEIKVTQAGVVDYLGSAVDNVIGKILDNGKATIRIIASEQLKSVGKIYIDNYVSEGDNLLLSIDSFTKSDNGLVYTYDFYATNWKDNAENARVRIVGPCAVDQYDLENETTAYCYFMVDMIQPLFIKDNGLTPFTNIDTETPWVRKCSSDNSYYLTSVKTWTMTGRAEDNDNMGRTGETDNEYHAITTVYVNDTAQTMIRMENGDWSSTITLQEGVNVVRVVVKDRVGNQIENKLDNVFCDNLRPVVQFVSVGGKTWTDNNVVISDNTPTIRIKIQDPGFSACTGMGIPRDNFRVVLSDNANFCENIGAIDNLDNNGIWDNGACADTYNFENTWDNTNSTTTGGLKDGYWYIGVTVSDNVEQGRGTGRENENYWMRFKVDTTKPTAPASVTGSVTAGASAAARTRITTTSITLSGTAEASAGIKVEITTDNGVSWTEQAGAAATVDSSGNWTATVTVTQGVTTGIRVKATDSGGNESTATTFGYVLADTNSPTVAITSPAEGTTTDQASITITGTLGKDTWESWDDITLTIQVGTNSVTVPISVGSFTYSVSLAEGTNTIVSSVSDGLNTTGTASVSVTRTVTPWATYAIIIVIVALILAAIAIFRKR